MRFNEPGWISLEPRNHVVFETLVSFVDNASSDPTNVQHIADSTVSTLRAAGTHNPSVDQYRFESRVLFGILFTIVKQLDAAAVCSKIILSSCSYHSDMCLYHQVWLKRSTHELRTAI